MNDWMQEIVRIERRRFDELDASLKRLRKIAEEVEEDGDLTETAYTMLSEALEGIVSDEEQALEAAKKRLEAAQSGKIALMDAAFDAARAIDPGFSTRFIDDNGPALCEFCTDYLREIVASVEDGRKLCIPVCIACNLAFVNDDAVAAFELARKKR